MQKILDQFKTTPLRLFALVLFSYMGFGLFAFFNQRAMTYYPRTYDFEGCPGFRDYAKINHNGTRMYVKKTSTQNVVVHYHGNASTACDESLFKDAFEQPNTSVIFVEYAGYGEDPRKPSQDLILQDVQNVADYIQAQGFENVILFGQSLGSGAASYHAKISKVDTLILVSPFYSLMDVAKRHFWFYPVRWMLKENYTNHAWLENYQGRLVILHGDQDQTVPQATSQKLFENLDVQDKEYITIHGARHNDIWNFEDFRPSIQAEIIQSISR